ncbi:hypothetical protein [Kutzneria kofuensis]|uniref:hypothetical protein n=1 Tax=Kutzneria kofuensis TaxID=103725 RepID=UPI0031EE48E4
MRVETVHQVCHSGTSTSGGRASRAPLHQGPHVVVFRRREPQRPGEGVEDLP